jgi:hypothetical protein
LVLTPKEHAMPARTATRGSIAVIEQADASPATLKSKFAALEAEAMRSWRQYAADMAADGRSPQPEEVLRVGAILRIANPPTALEADAQALREMRRIEDRIARDTREAAAVVEPWAGDRARLLADIESTEQRVKDMKRALLIGFSGGSDWFKPREQLRRENPRVFPKEARR